MSSSPLSVAERIDAACDRFETDWRAGRSPRLEDYLTSCSGLVRVEMLRALLAVELELCGGQQTSPDIQSYQARFPDLGHVVEEVFGEAASRRRSHETSVSQDSARDDTAVMQSPRELPRSVGRFEVVALLGEGAFGTVYRARDPQLDREVAIKVPKLSALGDGFDLRRFLREARAAATIRHPNVCPVHEVGEDAGRPYIVMTYVPGKSLGEHLAARKSPMPQRQAALIVRKLALALDAAHAHHVIHRDLKPANVLLDEVRKDVVLTDFGLARNERSEGALRTRSGTIVGTPAYMSPEQARGDLRAVGARSDIYSLGVVLYEMLGGQRPFTGRTGEVIGAILHVMPAPPSRHRPDLDPRLEAICLKAMAKNPAERYGSMRALAEALDGVLREEAPARPRTNPSWWWLSLPVGVIALGLATALAWLDPPFSPSEPTTDVASPGELSLPKPVPQVPLDYLDRDLMPVPERPDWLPRELVGVLGSRRLRHNARRLAVHPEGKWAASGCSLDDVVVWDIATGHEVAALKGCGGVFTPDGKQMIVVDRNQVSWWDVATRRVVRTVTVSGLDGVWSEWGRWAVSRDGRWLAAGLGDKLNVWDLSEGKTVHSESLGPIAGLDFSPDGETLAIGHWRRDGVILWDVAGRKERKWLGGHTGPVPGVAFNADGTLLATGGLDTTVRLWNARTAQEIRTFKGHAAQVYAVAFQPGGQVLASGGQEFTVKLWDAGTGNELRTLRGHKAGLSEIVFTTDGEKVITAAEDGTVRVWEAASGREVFAPVGHEGTVNTVVVSPDGSAIATGSGDHTLKLWDAKTGRERQTLILHRNAVRSAAFSADGRTLASASMDGTVRLWDAATGKSLRSLDVFPGGVHAVALSADGRYLVAGTAEDGTVPGRSFHAEVWDLETYERRHVLKGFSYYVGGVAFSPREPLAAVSGGSDVRLFDAISGEEKAHLKGHRHEVVGVAFSPDGGRLASASHDGTLRVWEVPSGQLVREIKGHTEIVKAVTWSPDGQMLASTSEDGTARLWNPDTGDEVKVFRLYRGSGGFLRQVTFSPEGRHLLVAGDGVAYVLRLAVSQEGR